MLTVNKVKETRNADLKFKKNANSFDWLDIAMVA